MGNIFSRFSHHYRDIPNKKPYIEFFAALLTIPVLLTVILLNLNSLKGEKDKNENTKQQTVVVTVPAEDRDIISKTPTEPCSPGLGTTAITSPDENEVITYDIVPVSIQYTKGDYCEAVWSYRINGGKWSDYDDKSIALYQLPKGDIKLELRVKSIVSAETETLTRKFVYQGESPSPTSSTSAN